MRPFFSYMALCHSESVAKEEGSNAKTRIEGQKCFTTKDLSASEGQAGTKSTKEEEEYKALDIASWFSEITQQPPH